MHFISQLVNTCHSKVSNIASHLSLHIHCNMSKFAGCKKLHGWDRVCFKCCVSFVMPYHRNLTRAVHIWP